MKAWEQQQMLMSNALTGIYELRGVTDQSRGIIEPMCDDDEAIEIADDLDRVLQVERPMTAKEDAVIGHIVREWQRLDAAGDPDAEDDRPFKDWMDNWWPDVAAAAKFADEAMRNAPPAPPALNVAISDGEDLPF